MAKILNWGLLSTARINRALIKPLNASKRTRLLAVASRSQSKADEYAREWKIPRAHGSYEALLADPEIDIIYNSLPNHLHAEWTIKALRAGKHVLCEKPLAISIEEVDEVLRTAQETGKIVAEAFMYRHHPQTLKVKEIVDSGRLGKIQLVKSAFTFMIQQEDDPRLFKELGGGSIWDVGCYPISYARTMLGLEPVEVFGWQVLGPGGCDEIFIGQMKFKDEIHMQFDSGFRSPQRWYIEIVGTEATLYVPSPFKPGTKTEIQIKRGDEIEKIAIKGNELYMGEVDDMCDAVLNGTSPRISLEDTRKNTTAILALIKSAETGQKITL